MIATTCTPTKIVASPPRNRCRSSSPRRARRRRAAAGSRAAGPTRRSRRAAPTRRSRRRGRCTTRADCSSRAPPIVGRSPSVSAAQRRRGEQPVGHHDQRGRAEALDQLEAADRRRGTRPSASTSACQPSAATAVAASTGECALVSGRGIDAGDGARRRRRAPSAGAAASSSRPRRPRRRSRATGASSSHGCVDRDRATPRRRARAPSTRRSPPTFTHTPAAPSVDELLGHEVGGEALADPAGVEPDPGRDADGARRRRRPRCGRAPVQQHRGARPRARPSRSKLST